MKITYPPIKCKINGKDGELFHGIATTLPGSPRVTISSNAISEEWKCGENVLFRAESEDGLHFTPISNSQYLI
jgi:hypothetical protein